VGTLRLLGPLFEIPGALVVGPEVPNREANRIGRVADDPPIREHLARKMTQERVGMPRGRRLVRKGRTQGARIPQERGVRTVHRSDEGSG